MLAKEFIKVGLLEKSRSNLDDVQFQILLHLEEGDELSPELEFKIKRLGIKTGISRMEVLTSAFSNRLAAVSLAKDVKKQREPENLQFKYLREIRGLDIDKLDEMGSEAIRIINGELVVGGKATLNGTKAIDAMNGKEFISLKYTEEPGGAQDNQIADVRRYLEEANKYVNTHNDAYTFAAIVDGEYIESRIHELREFFNSDRIGVFTCDTYKSFANNAN